jgi:hypothetical protein
LNWWTHSQSEKLEELEAFGFQIVVKKRAWEQSQRREDEQILTSKH